jgi:hypothetical protein
VKTRRTFDEMTAWIKAALTAGDVQRFWAQVKVTVTDKCWAWQGGYGDKGYGHFSLKLHGEYRSVLAHRIAYLLTHGSLPPDPLVLDHRCDTRGCVNPSHLTASTNQANVLRGVGVTARNAQLTHCKYGHPFTPENTLYRKDRFKRVCRECNRKQSREWKAQRRATVEA